MKNFNGKAIYNPSGKAGEYSYWACNFYVGCSNSCTYCYCKKGILASAMGQDKPQLKKCFRNETHALEVFLKELTLNLNQLKKHGLFFSFTTDPLLPETESLTYWAMGHAVNNGIPVKVLTKCTQWIDDFLKLDFTDSDCQKYISIGFTLTGHDELEPFAATSAERIEAMKKLHNAGFKTWASIEPIIDFASSWNMIYRTKEFCSLYKIGLKSGGTMYDRQESKDFVKQVNHLLRPFKSVIYWKDSILKVSGIRRESLPSNCVTRYFNL
jgi:DNA repair photolyase